MRVLFLYLPVHDIPFGRVEVDAHLGNRQPREGETLAILSEVNLSHRSLGTLVELQLEEVEVGSRL